MSSDKKTLNPPASGGPTEGLVRHISAVKNEPEWMLEKRFASN